jgi:arylsulfatase A-like enzyme
MHFPKPSLTRFLWAAGLAILLTSRTTDAADSRPNILLCIADDASWHHFGANGDNVVRTPNFDRVAREGVNFRNAFCSSPSCTPSRGALLTGQHFWRLEDGGNLWSRWPNKFAVYPDLLAKAGYHVGLQGKGWGPGDFKFGGREHNPAGPGVRDFSTFLKSAPEGKPFCFWFGSTDPHRLYERGSGVKAGLKIKDVQVPPYLVDTPAVRSDMLDYYAEIERFDRDIGAMLKVLEERGELDNTLVVITSDNGWPFPRGKATCYDAGARMPLAIRWPAKAKGGRVVDDFVSHTDLAHTFLEAAGLKTPSEMTGRSLLPLLASDKSGQIETGRDAALFGRERHASVRAGNVGYPVRAIRTRDYLYLLNFKPDRWPAGDPPLYGDVDQHLNIDGSPTKQAMVEHGGDPVVKRLFDLAFGKRPAEELYDVNADPWQTNNVAGSPRHAGAKEKLRARLEQYLAAMGDPRARADGDIFDRYFYVTGANRPQNRSPISLHASNAVVHGTMLRYEPQTNKNCLGYWTKAEDWAEWTFDVRQPGEFEIEVWQGCGKGQGGSDVAVELGGKRFDFIVEDTGHFQNFVPRRVGRTQLAAGRHSLAIKPQRKKAAAVMDIQLVRLIPVEAAAKLPPSPKD